MNKIIGNTTATPIKLDKYATNAYVDEELAKKAESEHEHNKQYYTKNEIDASIAEVAQRTQVQIITWGADD